jgi:hypothetical protein
LRKAKAVILAAGNQTLRNGRPLVLQPWASAASLNASWRMRSVCRRQDIYVVVGYRQDEVRAHLGDKVRYVVQEEPLGTGDAVLQALPLLRDFPGQSADPLRRHAAVPPRLDSRAAQPAPLAKADLTLLTAVVDRALPYGRIIRDAAGEIIDIIEDTEASPERARNPRVERGRLRGGCRAIAPRWRAGAFAARWRIPAHRLRSRVDPFGPARGELPIYDQDEVQGINTAEDLAQAEFILQKRLFRPRRQEEQNLVAFGTGGWRAIIGEGFTMHNVRRLSQALANEITRRSEEKRGVIVGYDRRFLSKQAAEAAARCSPATTSHHSAERRCAHAADHLRHGAEGDRRTAWLHRQPQPAEWNGLKVFRGDGSLLLDDETRQIENETNALTPDDVIKLELDLALEAGIVERRDFTNEYVDAVEKLIDLEAIRKAGLKVIVDPMYGVGQLTLGTVLTEARCRVTFIHERHNPLFGGRSPAPNLEALRMLSSQMQDHGYDVGLAMDGDADRIAIVDERGEYISVNDLLLLLYWYLHEVRGERGGVVRNLATTHLLDRLAARLGEECYEVPVGFKHIVNAMRSTTRCWAANRRAG